MFGSASHTVSMSVIATFMEQLGSFSTCHVKEHNLHHVPKVYLILKIEMIV